MPIEHLSSPKSHKGNGCRVHPLVGSSQPSPERKRGNRPPSPSVAADRVTIPPKSNPPRVNHLTAIRQPTNLENINPIRMKNAIKETASAHLFIPRRRERYSLEMGYHKSYCALHRTARPFYKWDKQVSVPR